MPALDDHPLPATARHPHARAVLTAALRNPSHAYLLGGPAGAGKRETARDLAAALVAEGAADPADSARRVREGVHPDFTWVTPSGAADLRREDIDEPVVAAATRTPFESRRRVFVIEGVDTMTDAAANRMLKTLEEPPPFVHIILLSDRPAEVLPTIRSRCQLVRFEAPAPAELAERLNVRHGVPPQTADACARLALGDGNRALGLALCDGPALREAAEAYATAALDPDARAQPWVALLARASALGDAAGSDTRERLLADLDLVPVKERKRVEREAEEAAKRSARRARTRALDHALQLVGLWFRDLAAVADGAPDLVHNTDRELDPSGRSSAALRQAVARVDEIRAALAVNPTEDLQLEALLHRLRRTLATR